MRHVAARRFGRPMPLDSPQSGSASWTVQRLEALAHVQTKLAEAELDLDTFMQAVVDELERLVGASGVVLELVEGREMVYRATNKALAGFVGMRIKRFGSLSGLCADKGEILLCRDTADDPRVDRAACERTGIKSMICAPLLQQGAAIGVLKISSDRVDAFGASEIHALRLLTAILAAEMGKQLRFERTERMLEEWTERSLELAREVGERLRLENSLRANEQRLANIIANAHQAIVTTSERGIITCWNRQAALTFGWSEEEALGRDIADLIIPPELHASHDEGMKRFLQTEEGSLIGKRVEVEALHRSGARIPIEIAINATRMSEGWEFTALLHDISERRSRTELFENGFYHAPIGMALMDLNGGFLKVNDSFCDIVGYSPDELRTRDFKSITHADDVGRDTSFLGQMLAGEISNYKIGKRYIRKNGETVWVRLSVSLVEADDGAPKHFIAQVENLTSEREAETRYRLMAENSTDIIVTGDGQGRLTFISPACEAILGLSEADVLGKLFIDYVHPDDLPGVRRRFARLNRTGSCERFRWRARHRPSIWLESSPALLRETGGDEVIGYIDVVRDVTAQKAQEDALAAARLRAEEAVRSKSDFVANMSHELRTPLNSIIGFSHLLVDAPNLDAETQRRIGLIHNAGQALQGVIDNVLDFSKLEAAALELNASPFDLPIFLRETVALLEPQAAARDLPLRLLISPDVPSSAAADEGRLRQVLLNLLSNAVKFTREGAVTVSVWPLSVSENDFRIRVEVRDTGPGIPPERLESLFGRFVQAGPTVASHYGGTGLGLAISRQLIELMGGAMGVSSSLGEGATFWFELPLARAEGAAVDRSELRALTQDALQGRRILVVDDVDLNRDLMLAMLSRYGCEVEIAEHGAAAVAAIFARPFDLVLMDCQMPVMDGFAATQAVRAAGGSYAKLPIVALTASAQQSHLDRCKSAGMDDHLTKPLHHGALERMLVRFLSGSEARRPADPPSSPASSTKPSLEERYRQRKTNALAAIGRIAQAGAPSAADLNEIATVAHQIAGTAGMFGDAEFGAAAHALEVGIERWTPAELKDALRAAFERLQRAQ
ncbi:PAS domain S-box protein [Sphingosinicella sp. BN140058]|nr:PAS domain S-box protein [Sphingosinicella sp. BN140058]